MISSWAAVVIAVQSTAPWPLEAWAAVEGLAFDEAPVLAPLLPLHAERRATSRVGTTSLNRIAASYSMGLCWSGREDLNLRPHRPERCALPNCATPRPSSIGYRWEAKSSSRPH